MHGFTKRIAAVALVALAVTAPAASTPTPKAGDYGYPSVATGGTLNEPVRESGYPSVALGGQNAAAAAARTTSRASDGFDWGDAGIGVGVGVALALALALGASAGGVRIVRSA
jgi:hypothetical protein